MNLKHILSLTLSLILILGILVPVSAVRAVELENLPEEFSSEADWISARWPLEILDAGDLKSSQLQNGTAYFFRGDTTLTLDVDLDCGPLVSAGTMTIRGTASLRCPILRGKDFTLESGTITVPVLDDRSCEEYHLVNGISSHLGRLGTVISGGAIMECPLLTSSQIGCLYVNGGLVHADHIENGYIQSGGQVVTNAILKSGKSILNGGCLECSSHAGDDLYLFVWRGSVLCHCTPDSAPFLDTVFPAIVTEPALGAQDYDHILVETVDEKIPFTDVPENSYYRNPVAWGDYCNVVHGVSTDLFAPDMICTRSQVVTFLWRAAGSPAPKSRVNPFRDVPDGTWYTDAVLWAVEQGITKGTTQDHFSPDAICTRGQIVTFLWRFDGNPTPKDTDHSYFYDVPKSSFCYLAVNWATEQNVTRGGIGDHLFGPNLSCSRAEAITFLFRLQNPHEFLFPDF